MGGCRRGGGLIGAFFRGPGGSFRGRGGRFKDQNGLSSGPFSHSGAFCNLDESDFMDFPGREEALRCFASSSSMFDLRTDVTRRVVMEARFVPPRQISKGCSVLAQKFDEQFDARFASFARKRESKTPRNSWIPARASSRKRGSRQLGRNDGRIIQCISEKPH
jgi:hypothetical protein